MAPRPIVPPRTLPILRSTPTVHRDVVSHGGHPTFAGVSLNRDVPFGVALLELCRFLWIGRNLSQGQGAGRAGATARRWSR